MRIKLAISCFLLGAAVTFAGDLPQQTSTADLNGDGTVNLIDFAILSACWMADCSCNGKECGGDGCGGPSCGTCGQNETCDNGQCVLNCTNNGFVAVTETASVFGGDTFYTAQTNPTEPFDQLSLENYPSQGGLIRGGPWTFAGLTANCGVCVLINQNVNGGVPDKIFLAESGTLNLTSLGGVGSQLTGSFTDLVLIEVTIDPQTFASDPVTNGDNWCIDTYSFDVTIN